jgi:hypothetical protein
MSSFLVATCVPQTLKYINFLGNDRRVHINAHGQKYFRASKKTQVATAYTLVYGGARKSCFCGSKQVFVSAATRSTRHGRGTRSKPLARVGKTKGETAFVGELRILNCGR